MPSNPDSPDASRDQWLSRWPLQTWKLTRRSFLAACLLGCSLGPRRPPIAKEPHEVTWALVSDTHISASRDRIVRGSCMAGNLERAVEDITSADPDHVLFNGDLAYARGEQADYAAFQDLIAPLRTQRTSVHLTIGNHDDRVRFVEAFAVTASSGVPNKISSSARIGGVDWFFLDSLEETNAIRGSLGAAQQAWLERMLDANTAPAIVCVHHNPEPSLVGLKDTEALLRVILPRRRVKALFFGHTHVFRVRQKEGLHFVNLPATGYRFFKADVPLGWVRATLGPSRMRLELRGIDPRDGDHGTVLDLPWRSDA